MFSVGFASNESVFRTIRAEATQRRLWQPGNIFIICTWQGWSLRSTEGRKLFPECKTLCFFCFLMLQTAEFEFQHVRVCVVFFLFGCQQLFVFLARRPPAGTLLWNQTRLCKEFFHLRLIRRVKQPAAPPQDDRRIARQRRISNICPIIFLRRADFFPTRLR